LTNLQKGLVAGGAVVVLGAIIAASMLSKGGEKGIEVYYGKAEKRDLASVVTATGQIQARTKVNVQSSVIGEIIQLPVKEGDVVKKGDLLVQIDPERYRSEVDRLEANLRVQEIALGQARLDYADAERTLKRQKQLYDSSGLVSQELLDRSELAYRTAEISLRTLAERIEQAKADLAKSRDDLSKTTLRSPIDGTVTQLNAEKGEITLTGTMNNPGTVIMVVSDMGEILSEVDVDETRVARIERGQKSRIVVDAIGESEPYTGKVDEIAGSAVTRQGTAVQVFPVKILLDNVDARLRPGMTARARIETKTADDALVVPIQAVLLRPTAEIDKALAGDKDKKDEAKKDEAKKDEAKKDEAKADEPKPEDAKPVEAKDGKPADDKKAEDKKAGGDREVVFRVVDGKTVLTPVKTGLSDETSVVILEGLKEGDVVVTGPYRTIKTLKHGVAVREKKEEEKKDDKESESGVQVEVD
jgi:HlyD family secretion protein